MEIGETRKELEKAEMKLPLLLRMDSTSLLGVLIKKVGINVAGITF